MIENNVPKVFISYSWESKEHSDWVNSLAVDYSQVNRHENTKIS